MARSVEQIINIEFKKKFTDTFSQQFLTDVQTELAQIIHNIIESRTDAGFDVRGQRFRSLSAKYRKLKQRVIKGRAKLPNRKKPNKQIANLISRKIAGKSARSVNDFMHLTGELFDDIRFKTTIPTASLTKIKMPIKFFVANRSVDKAHGLKYKMKRDMFFLSKSGKYKKIELDIIRDFIVDTFRDRINKTSIKVNII